MLGALFGYFLGTMQVLLVDWFQRRAAHSRQLRLLRSDLMNAATYDKKFNWGAATDDVVPRPPTVSPSFHDTLADVDFTLTDEHSDDNSQQGLLGITSGFGVLQHYFDKWYAISEEITREGDPARRQALRVRGIEYMNEYDRRVDEVMFLIDNAIGDLERRLYEARLPKQIERKFQKAKPGENPPSLTPNDPRVREFLERKKRLRDRTAPD